MKRKRGKGRKEGKETYDKLLGKTVTAFDHLLKLCCEVNDLRLLITVQSNRNKLIQ